VLRETEKSSAAEPTRQTALEKLIADFEATGFEQTEDTSDRKPKKASEFIWIMGNGNKVPMSKMKTTHVFYAYRMIWNNTMPEPVPDNPKFYEFQQSTHPKKYLKKAWKEFDVELMLRKDLPEKMIDQITWMDQTAHKLGYNPGGKL